MVGLARLRGHVHYIIMYECEIVEQLNTKLHAMHPHLFHQKFIAHEAQHRTYPFTAFLQKVATRVVQRAVIVQMIMK